MEKVKMFGITFLIFLIMMVIVSPAVWADEVEPYPITFTELESYKNYLDDPAPFYKNIGWYEKVMPPEIWARMTYDVEKMKETWSEVVDLKAPDLVGKIAPEIKPGKYTYTDKEKYPFEKLMWKQTYDRFNPPGTTNNHMGNFTEIEVVPTQQYYWALPVAEATVKHMGKTKLDNEGYLIEESYDRGIPFPRPSGKFKAQQIMYNWVKRYIYGESYIYMGHDMGVNKNWKIDLDGVNTSYFFKVRGRVLQQPYGWYDERAERQGEREVYLSKMHSPRDLYGNVISVTIYDDPKKINDLYLYYVNSLRRIRRLSSSDRQEVMPGQDATWDDMSFFTQKLTPYRFPYTYKVIDEREFLVPMTTDGEAYIDSKDKFSYKLLKFERRPMWVVELNQQDPNYCYSKRVFYYDKETLMPATVHNYDQKGRLFRTWDTIWAFIPPMGQFHWHHYLTLNYVDIHSSCSYGRGYPAEWMNRTHINITAMIRAK